MIKSRLPCLLKRKLPPIALILILAFLVVPLDYSSYNVSENQTVDVNHSLADIEYASDIAREVYHSVSESEYSNFVRDFSDIGPKLYGTQGNLDAQAWILERLSDVTNNRIVGEVVGVYENVIGKLPGENHQASPAIMVGAHYDTVSVSPGANDDGSGVATTLEVARVLSQYDWPIDIYFGFWNNEEAGLHGSYETATEFWDDEIDILIYYNIDMLLVPSSDAPSDERILMAYNAGGNAIYQDSQYWAELAMAMGNNYDNRLIKPIPSTHWSTWWYSDHFSFLNAGYPNVIFAHETGGDEDVAYHTARDTWGNSLYQYSIATDTTASIAAAVAFALSRVRNQKVYERHDIKGLPAGESVSFLVPMNLKTELGITTNSDASGIVQMRIINPAGTQLFQNNIDLNTRFAFNTTSLGVYQIVITTLPNSNDFTVTMDYDTDIEGDKVADSEHWWYDTFGMDFDNDGPNVDDEDTGDTEEIPPDGDLDGD